MSNTTTLADHLAALNAKTEAWIAAGPDRWATLWMTDLAHWARQGVHTVEDFELSCLRGELWDAYKEAHGIRPRWMGVNDMSREDLEKELESLREGERWEREEKERRAKKAVLVANKRALKARRFDQQFNSLAAALA